MYHNNKKCSSYSRFPRVFIKGKTSPLDVKKGKLAHGHDDDDDDIGSYIAHLQSSMRFTIRIMG